MFKNTFFLDKLMDGEKDKVWVLVGVLIGIIILVSTLFILSARGFFTEEISDCKITKTDYPTEVNRFRDFNISVTVSNFGNKECELWGIWIPQLYNSDLSIKEKLSPKETKTYFLVTSGTGHVGGKAFEIILQQNNKKDVIENGFIIFNP
jgi:hypothetical protein